MSKIKVKINITSSNDTNTYKTTAIIQDNIIKYLEDNKTTTTYDYNNQLLTRENKELKMRYTFNLKDKTQGSIFIKELNKELNVEIETKKIERKDNNIKIKFIIENDIFLYEIEELK
jgi:hypothetical protein